MHADAVRAGDKFVIARSERELRYWTARRANAEIIDAPTDNERVQFGSTVTILRDDGRQQTYRIVGEDEADPTRGTLSHVSPLARALFGKHAGDTIRIGEQEADIIAID